MIDPLLAFRPEFPILAKTNYLVSNSLGAMPRAAADRLAEYARTWSERGVRAWADGWWNMPVTVGDEIAPLIGAGTGEVAMMPNVSLAHATILSALDFKPPRDTIVMTALDFPSVRYVVEQMAARLGARVVTVPSDDGIGIDQERLLAAIDERTRLVAVSHVLFRSAYIMDAAAIIQRAHDVGALVALDAFHSVGVIPVDVKANGADFLLGGVLKWLCGGPGGAFLYTAPSVRDTLAPALTGWQAHAQPFAFAPQMEFASGAWRWLGGTPGIPALYAAAEGPKLVRRAGIERVRAKSMRQTAKLIELAGARGYEVHAPRDAARRGGTVAFRVPHAYEVSQALLARDVIVDYRPDAGIRVAPHFYTHDDEIEAAVSAIDEILAQETWRKHAGARSVVT
jgi:kynureninase